MASLHGKETYNSAVHDILLYVKIVFPKCIEYKGLRMTDTYNIQYPSI